MGLDPLSLRHQKGRFQDDAESDPFPDSGMSLVSKNNRITALIGCLVVPYGAASVHS